MCGGMATYRGENAAALGQGTTMPVWAFRAEPDTMVSINGPNCRSRQSDGVAGGAHVHFTRYRIVPDDLGHGCWTSWYQTPELHEWLLKHENHELAAKGLDWTWHVPSTRLA